MSDESSPSRQPFDLERLRELFEMMEKHDVTEVSLRQRGERWHVRRGTEPVAAGFPPGFVAPQMPVAASPAPPAATEAGSSAAREEAADGILIKSPTVGTFYAAPSPDDPPFVKVGAKVEPETVVCIVEAMKVFNQIPAEVSGTIVEILVSNGDPVEFNQPLFRVQPG